MTESEAIVAEFEAQIAEQGEIIQVDTATVVAFVGLTAETRSLAISGFKPGLVGDVWVGMLESPPTVHTKVGARNESYRIDYLEALFVRGVQYGWHFKLTQA